MREMSDFVEKWFKQHNIRKIIPEDGRLDDTMTWRQIDDLLVVLTSFLCEDQGKYRYKPIEGSRIESADEYNLIVNSTQSDCTFRI